MSNIVKDRKGLELISRDLIFDSTLSDRARFVYIYMMAKPDNWDFYLEPMAKEIGYSVETLRKYIKELINAGWLTKVSQSRAAKDNTFGACEYIIHEDKEGSRAINFPTREISDTEKTIDRDYSNNNSTIESNKKTEKDISTAKFDFRAAMISLGVKPNVVDTWITIRKRKSANNSEIAFNSTKRQIDLAYDRYGVSPNTCIQISAENSWMGFKAEWLNGMDLSFYAEQERVDDKPKQLPLFDDSGEWQG